MTTAAAAYPREPIYVEVSPLLNRSLLTGVGRFAGRLVEALAKRAPLRLVNTIQGDHARGMRLANVLPAGYEMAVTAADLPPADHDVARWARRLTKRPLRRHDPRRAGDAAAVFSMLRPADRHFRREVGVFYDFTSVLLPWAHVPETREHFGRLFTKTAPLFDGVVAISRSTKADARWLCTLPNDRISVSYPGPSLCVHAHAHPEPVERTRNIILVVSTLEPRKNAQFLLHWYLHTDALPDDAELWWVGPRGWLTNSGNELKGTRARSERVKFLGVVSDAELCRLYRRAAFTIYPSLYEGFGFPVLDSLLHGAPVLCGFNSSLQEFDCPGVCYFDGCEPESVDAAYRELRERPSPPIDVESLRERFSWDGMARTVLRLCA